MQIRGSGPRPLPNSRISAVMFAMFASMASLYVAGRLWQDAQSRVYLIKELDRRTGQGQSAISVDETLKLVDCRQQHKKLAALEMELVVARNKGFVGQYSSETNGTNFSRKRLLVVIGIATGFERKKQRDAVRKSWLATGAAMKKLELEKGVVARFVIGRSANRGDSADREIDNENWKTNDFIILDNHVEASEEQPKKTKLFLAHAAEAWDAEFYAKINDDVYVNIDALGTMLAAHLDKPRAYIGCMKSGEVFSDKSQKWFEPEWWKFGDGKSYFRHASGEMFVVSRALAKFISINRAILRTYAHDDVSVGSWMIGLNVQHINEGKLCCSSWSSGAVCAAV
ncbi:hydroxyproline O-galactosyltransferase HPGT1-like isoform X1 [Zingiber officinale]|uniref:hydroxyproline O-galactosyltransferase HPGT1-like isoform X1 n=1 Tax=Zingiber officinale TaxID=94328 RepID=UPI001C4D4527|nr:hydroxyproline O-galactosyltransferase HPGT1-like isoform X1 [Zingiber officinale]